MYAFEHYLQTRNHFFAKIFSGFAPVLFSGPDCQGKNIVCQEANRRVLPLQGCFSRRAFRLLFILNTFGVPFLIVSLTNNQ
jgi:hypothetical protein